MKLWKLLPAGVLMAGAVVAMPAASFASTAHTPPKLSNATATPPAGVSVSGAIHYAPGIASHIPKTDLPDAHAASPRAAVPSGILVSGNWAGMVELPAKGKTFTSMGTRERIPVQSASQKSACVTAASEDDIGISYAYYWSGLDGWNSGTVEQQGAATYCEDTGTIGNFLWYEMYPSGPVTFSGVNPGDEVVMITTFKSNKYQLYVHDLTNGGTVSVDLPCSANGGTACDRNSAEVITEDPGGGPAGGVALADYGSVSYTNSVVDGDGISGPLSHTADWSGWHTWEYDGSTVMQSTSNLNSAGNAFSNGFANSGF